MCWYVLISMIMIVAMMVICCSVVVTIGGSGSVASIVRLRAKACFLFFSASFRCSVLAHIVLIMVLMVLLCVECPSTTVSAVRAVLFFAMVLFLSWIVMSGASNPWFALRFELLNFFQTLAVVSNISHAQDRGGGQISEFASNSARFFELLSIFNLNPELLFADCLFDLSVVSRFFLALMPPVFILIGIRIIEATAKRNEQEDVSRLDVGHASRIAYSVTFVPLIIALSQVLDCTGQPNDTSTLDAWPTFVCFEGNYWIILGVVGVPVFVYCVLLPWLLYVRIKKEKDKFLGTVHVLRHGWVTMRFRTKYWWWENVIHVWKALVVLPAVVFSQNLAGVVVPFLACLAMTCLTLLWKPYRLRVANNGAAVMLLGEVLVWQLLMFHLNADVEFVDSVAAEFVDVQVILVTVLVAIFVLIFMSVEWKTGVVRRRTMGSTWEQEWKCVAKGRSAPARGKKRSANGKGKGKGKRHGKKRPSRRKK